jgi:hypothetical protein
MDNFFNIYACVFDMFIGEPYPSHTYMRSFTCISIILFYIWWFVCARVYYSTEPTLNVCYFVLLSNMQNINDCIMYRGFYNKSTSFWRCLSVCRDRQWSVSFLSHENFNDQMKKEKLCCLIFLNMYWTQVLYFV